MKADIFISEMFVRRVISTKFGHAYSVTWLLRLFLAVASLAYAFPALSEPMPIWANFAVESSDLSYDRVVALAAGADGALWIGTFGGGLARLDKDGRWWNYNKANTQGGLPDDRVSALAAGADGALWIGTYSGLARLAVGAPLAWGVWVTLQKTAAMFH